MTEGFVQFVLYSEFDADHILIPPMTKADLENLAEKLRGKGRVA